MSYKIIHDSSNSFRIVSAIANCFDSRSLVLVLIKSSIKTAWFFVNALISISDFSSSNIFVGTKPASTKSESSISDNSVNPWFISCLWILINTDKYPPIFWKLNRHYKWYADTCWKIAIFNTEFIVYITTNTFNKLTNFILRYGAGPARVNRLHEVGSLQLYNSPGW